MKKPTMRDRLRPLELLALSGGLAIFSGLVVLMSTRDVILAVIVLGIAFIVSLVGIAMLALAAGPTGEEKLEILDQDRDQLDDSNGARRGH